MLDFHRQVVLLGLLSKLRETSWSLQEGFLLMLLDFMPLSTGQQWGAISKQLAVVLGGGAALAAVETEGWSWSGPLDSLSFPVSLSSLFGWRSQEGQGSCASATHLDLGKRTEEVAGGERYIILEVLEQFYQNWERSTRLMWESSDTYPNGDIWRITAVSFGFTHRIWWLSFCFLPCACSIFIFLLSA